MGSLTKSPDTKLCGHCGLSKPLGQFPDDRRRKDGKYPYCAACHILKQKSYKKQAVDGELNGKRCKLCLVEVRGHANRQFCSNYCKNRTAALAKKYDLSPEDYRKLLDDCGGRCPICRSKPKNWPIDHNHKTLAVLGPVCARCNVGLLAYSNHDLETARRLVAFLEHPPTERVLGRVPMADPKHHQASKIHGTWGAIPF